MDFKYDEKSNRLTFESQYLPGLDELDYSNYLLNPVLLWDNSDQIGRIESISPDGKVSGEILDDIYAMNIFFLRRAKFDFMLTYSARITADFGKPVLTAISIAAI